MEVSREDGEIPIPISSSYGGHMIHHHHDPALLLVVPHSSPQAQSQLLPCSNGLVPTPTPTSLSLDNDNHDHDHNHSTEVIPYNSNGNGNGNGKKVVVIKYRECLKNHAAAMGGAATDGCGEFMPSGEEGTIEALTCSACSCHRNFHRKELQGHHHDHFHHHHISSSSRNRRERKLILGHHHHSNHLMADALPLGLGYPTPAAAGTLISSRPPPPHHHHMVMPSSAYNMNMNVNMDMSDDGGGGPHPHPQVQQVVKKRFRTKFSQEQKDKMVKFAERVGWRIQKQEESVVQQFCQEIGVKRRVLKVWMHNNKHNLANKLIPSTTASTAPAPPADAASLH